MREFIIFSNLFILIASILLIVNRFRKFKIGILRNFLFYILFFSLFYISLPSLISLITMHSWVGSNSDTILYASSYGFFVVGIFFIGYLFSNNRNILTFNKCKKSSALNFLPLCVLLLLSVYLIFVIFIHINDFSNYIGNRPLQSNFNTYLENNFKIKPIFYFTILLTTFLCINTRKFYYLFFLIPYFCIDILCGGRLYIFSMLIYYFTLSSFLGIKVNIKLFLVITLLIIIITIGRFSFELSPKYLIFIFYEFIFTWSSNHIALDINYPVDFIYHFNYSIFRIFPSFFYDFLFGMYVPVRYILGEHNPLGWGLSSSTLSDVLCYRNNLLLFLYPIFIVLYGNFLNYILKFKFYSCFLIFILSVTLVQIMFRSSFMDTIFYPIYVVWTLGFWLIIYDLIKFKKRISKTTIKNSIQHEII